MGTGKPATISARPADSLLLPVLGATVVLAWIGLWWLEQSPYGWLFHPHGKTGHDQHGSGKKYQDLFQHKRSINALMHISQNLLFRF